MRKILLVLGLLAFAGSPARAQLVVYDPAVTFRNAATAAIKEYILNAQRDQHRQLRRMARRLSMFTNLAKYRLADVPRWRTHDFENPDVFLFARAYHAALNYGDPSGRAFLAVSHPVEDPGPVLDRLTPAARRALLARMATLNLADASVIASTHDTGQLRYNGRRELAAIEALQRDVTDGSNEQSTTAVLDKISGAGLVAARQRQARIQLLSGIVEQLLIESKRTRDSEAATMNMQLATWRDAGTANQAFAAGAGDALRTWRQP
jgi:hypothetical protein